MLFLFNTLGSIIAFFVLLTLFKNYVFLIISPFYRVNEDLRYIRAVKKRRANPLIGAQPFSPKVSVIVPAWNEEVGIIKTIESIVFNGYDNFELIVVNDGSTDNSDFIIKRFFRNFKYRFPLYANQLVYKRQKNGGKGKALNTGIARSTGDIILTIDADSALRQGAIAKLVRYYADENIMAVVGNVKVVGAKTLIGLAQKLEYYFGFYNKRGHALLGAEYIFGGACASFRRHVFETIGLFDEANKTEDIEMSMRTRFHGFGCTYAEDVVCYTEGAADLKGLISQRIRWKKGRFDTFRKYRSMFFSTEESHNFFLSFFVLPFSMLAEIQLVFEPIAITILIVFSIIASEFLSLGIGILFILLVYVATALFNDERPHPMLILSFPFTWPLFYFLDWVEFIALWKSFRMMRQGQEVEWQKWNRQGIAHHL